MIQPTPEIIEYRRQIALKLEYWGMTGKWPTPKHIEEVRAQREKERHNDTRKD